MCRFIATCLMKCCCVVLQRMLAEKKSMHGIADVDRETMHFHQTEANFFFSSATQARSIGEYAINFCAASPYMCTSGGKWYLICITPNSPAIILPFFGSNTSQSPALDPLTSNPQTCLQTMLLSRLRCISMFMRCCSGLRAYVKHQFLSVPI